VQRDAVRVFLAPFLAQSVPRSEEEECLSEGEGHLIYDDSIVILEMILQRYNRRNMYQDKSEDGNKVRRNLSCPVEDDGDESHHVGQDLFIFGRYSILVADIAEQWV
jgi:hypothetical protein